MKFINFSYYCAAIDLSFYFILYCLLVFLKFLKFLKFWLVLFLLPSQNWLTKQFSYKALEHLTFILLGRKLTCHFLSSFAQSLNFASLSRAILKIPLFFFNNVSSLTFHVLFSSRYETCCTQLFSPILTLQLSTKLVKNTNNSYFQLKPVSSF